MAIFIEQRGLYRIAGGFLTREQVQAEIKRIQRFFERQAGLISKQLFAGQMSLVEWQIAMRDLIKASHILSATIGYGGFDQMNASRWGRVGVRLRREYAALNNFARQVEQGKVIFESQLTRRAQLYAKSFRGSYFIGEKATASGAGEESCRRVLHALESCSECRLWAGKGFVPIEEQPEIGTLKCKQFCLCTFEYS